MLAIAAFGLLGDAHQSTDASSYLRPDRKLGGLCKQGWQEIVVATADGDEYMGCRPACDALKPTQAKRREKHILAAFDAYDEFAAATDALTNEQASLEVAEAAEDVAEENWLQHRCEAGDASYRAKQASRVAFRANRLYERMVSNLEDIVATEGGDSPKAQRINARLEALQNSSEAAQAVADTLEDHVITNQSALDAAKVTLDETRAARTLASRLVAEDERNVERATRLKTRALARANKKVCYTECDIEDASKACWKFVKGVHICVPGDDCPTCEGNCESSHGEDCWCDEECTSYGDCCMDVTEFCGYGPWP